MNQSNYFQVGPDVHCLYCHFTVARKEFREHVEKHSGNPQSCEEANILECKEWAERFN